MTYLGSERIGMLLCCLPFCFRETRTVAWLNNAGQSTDVVVHNAVLPLILVDMGVESLEAPTTVMHSEKVRDSTMNPTCHVGGRFGQCGGHGDELY